MKAAQSANLSDDGLQINKYQEFTKKTDRNSDAGLDGMDFVFLGLFGEAGSLLSALKKKLRDKEGCVAYEQAVVEELGDVLWYFSNAAIRANIKLSDLTPSKQENITFAELQKAATGTNQQRKTEVHLLELASHIGALLNKYAGDKIRERQIFATDLERILTLIVEAAVTTSVSLTDAATHNMQKTISRWAPKEERDWGELFDINDREEEKLPRNIRVIFTEYSVGNSTYVIQRCNEINIGDRLTDNSIQDDDYRFHDVFHLAYAAVLGWSPVLR